LVGHTALASAATMVAATFVVRFADDEQALLHPDLEWAWLFPGFVGVTAGILTLRLRRWPHVGPSLVAGSAPAAAWGLWDLPRIWSAKGTSALNSGFFLEFAGLTGLVAAGVAALVCLRREHALAVARPAWASLALTGPLAVIAAVPFVAVSVLNIGSSETGNAAHDIAMATLAIAVPTLVAMLRPGDVARFVLLGWSVAAVGIVVAYWRLLSSAGASLHGIPYVLLALAALVAVAASNGPWRHPRAAPGEGTRADGRPGASQPGASQPGASQPGASQPGAS
jgi:hypothetical protein